MDDDLKLRRQQLVDRHDALTASSGRAAASAALCKVAEGLEAVAREAERRGAISVEVARTWRWAGMAYHDAAPDRDEATVRRAVDAYRAAERLIDRTTDVVDAIKTDYCMGRALLNLADGPDGSVAQRAVDRLNRARALARAAAPQLLPPIEEALISAEQVAALRDQTAEIDRRIARYSAELAGAAQDNDHELSSEDLKGLFSILEQQVAQEQVSMNPERRDSLSDVMDGLAQLVDRAGTKRSLNDITTDRASLDMMMERMKALIRRAGDE